MSISVHLQPQVFLQGQAIVLRGDCSAAQCSAALMASMPVQVRLAEKCTSLPRAQPRCSELPMTPPTRAYVYAYTGAEPGRRRYPGRHPARGRLFRGERPAHKHPALLHGCLLQHTTAAPP